MPITAAIRLRRVITNSAPPIDAAANAQNSSAMPVPCDSTTSPCGLRVTSASVLTVMTCGCATCALRAFGRRLRERLGREREPEPSVSSVTTARMRADLTRPPS